MEIAQLLKEMAAAPLKHKAGDLVLAWRIRLWSAMKREFGKESDYRRNVLAFLVAQEAYPDWEAGRLVSAIPPEELEQYHALPGRAMDEYARFLRGKANRKRLRSASDRLFESMDYWEGEPHVAMRFAYIIIAAVSHRIEGVDDEIYEEHQWYDAVWDGAGHLKIDDDSLVERDFCEPYYFAAESAALRAGREAVGRREYWGRWLAETVPSVMGPLSDVHSLLDSWTGPKIVVPEIPRSHEIPADDAEEALRQHLQGLALSAGEQQKLYGEIACQICGLAMTVGLWSAERSMARVVAAQNAVRRRKLSRVELLAADILQDTQVPCYDPEFTRRDARWKEMRKLARELLDDLGWARGRPPKRGSLLYGMLAD